MKKAILALCIIWSGSAYAQNFLWGVSGGGKSDGTGETENTKDIAFDKNGNIYIISQQSDNANVAGQSSTSYGSNDFVVASFKSDGSLRWKKVIGAPRTDVGYNIAVDDKDGVYFCGMVDKSNNPCNIDVDATSPQNGQMGILIKYDTAGVYQWHQHPEPVSQTVKFATSTCAMDVDKNGNVYWMTWLLAGSYGNGTLTVPTDGVYLLKYGPSGAFSYIKPQVEGGGALASNMQMTIDDANNRFYLSGTKSANTLSMNGNVIDGGYIACFNMDGTYVWSRSSANSGIAYKPAIDASGNLYLASGGGPNSSFNGYTITSTTTHGTPMIIKMDKNGNLIWGRHAETNASSYCGGVALLNGDEVMIAGAFPGDLKWPGFTAVEYTTPLNSGYDIFVTRFRRGDGVITGMDKIQNYLNHETVDCVAGDGKGNVYIGGEMSGTTKVNSLSTMNFTGGATDWYLVKYGDMWKTGVSAIASTGDIQLYPNPASSHITVSGITAGTTIQICDLLGREVINAMGNGDTSLLDVSNLVPASYLVRLGNGARVSIKQFIKQ